MKITKRQGEAILVRLRQMTIDDRTLVTIREDPSLAADPGVLQVKIRDHWGYECVRVDRYGRVTVPDPMERKDVIPGQTSIV